MKCLVYVLAVAMCGCTVSKNSSQEREQLHKELQQSHHMTATPAPEIEKSQERLNLIERLKRFNTDSKVSYIYLVDFGKVMAFYTVKGKVSSVNSQLTTTEQIVDHEYRWGLNIDRSSHVVAAPDLDGTYGDNGDSTIFFFTTDGTYVEWKGDYMLCDKPLKLTTPPELVIDVTEK